MVTTPIDDIIPYKQYIAGPGATEFGYNWWIGTAADLGVYKNGVLVDPALYTEYAQGIRPWKTEERTHMVADFLSKLSGPK